VRWEYVVDGETCVHFTGLDLVRYTAHHNVRGVDVEVAHPGWLDRLPPDFRADQGQALIERAFREVRLDLRGDLKADQAVRDAEIIDELVICKAQERLDDFRSRRDETAAQEALARLPEACEALKAGTGSLMPALIDAARAGVTNGEMIVPMREAFGWYVSE
jgi:hypothetical protein